MLYLIDYTYARMIDRSRAVAATMYSFLVGGVQLIDNKRFRGFNLSATGILKGMLVAVFSYI